MKMPFWKKFRLLLGVFQCCLEAAGLVYGVEIIEYLNKGGGVTKKAEGR